MATQRPTQQGLLDQLQDDHALFQKLIGQISDEDQQIAITPAGWSVKDLLSHTSHVKAATQKVIVAYTHDQPLPPVQPWSDEAFEEARQLDKEMSLPDVRNYWETTHTHLIHITADELNDERLLEEVRSPWSEDTAVLYTLVTSVLSHDAEHFELIEQYFEIGK